MKFGLKIIDSINITHFTHIISTVTKLCARTENKKCLLKITEDAVYFILPEFSSSANNSTGSGRTSFWISLDPKVLFEFLVCEGKSGPDDHLLMLEVKPESLLRALKSSPNIKMIRIKLTKRKQTCLTVELELHSMTAKQNSRTITHDIPIELLSSRDESNSFDEPDVSRTNLSIEMPPVKLLKHMIDRMKVLNDFVYFEANSQGNLTLKVEADAASVSTYFQGLHNLPCKRQQKNRNEEQNEEEENNGIDSSSVRLNLKKLAEFINALQFQPSKIICNFVHRKFAHFFVLHDDDLVLQYLISSVMS